MKYATFFPQRPRSIDPQELKLFNDAEMSEFLTISTHHNHTYHALKATTKNE